MSPPILTIVATQLMPPVLPAPALPLRTERLVLRPFVLDDADAFVGAWASEEWTSLLLSRPMNRAEVHAMVRRRTEPGDGKFIGLVVVTQVSSFAVGMVLGAYAAWRRNSKHSSRAWMHTRCTRRCSTRKLRNAAPGSNSNWAN